MRKQLYLSTLAFLLVSLAPLWAKADQITYQAEMPFTLVPDQFNLELPKFDSSLGDIFGIEICVTASGNIETDIDNLEPEGGVAQGLIHGLIDIETPSMFGVGFDLTGSNTFPGDFMGQIVVDVEGTATYEIAAADFGFFVAGTPGEQFSSLVCMETAEVFGDPAIVPDFQTGVVDSGVLKVTYLFTIPEPSSPILVIVVGMAWANFSRARRA